jgi:hypothetical protein
MTGLRHLAQPASALAVAMGVGRFVYTLMLPLMTGQAGLTAEAGASVATANYVGYFAGSVAGHQFSVLAIVMTSRIAARPRSKTPSSSLARVARRRLETHCPDRTVTQGGSNAAAHRVEGP